LGSKKEDVFFVFSKGKQVAVTFYKTVDESKDNRHVQNNTALKNYAN